MMEVEVENTKEWKVGNVYDYTVRDAIEEEQLEEAFCDKSETLETLRFGWTIENFDSMRKEMAAKRTEPDEQRLRSQAYEFGDTPFKWRLLLYPNGHPSVNFNSQTSHMSVYAEVIHDPSPRAQEGTASQSSNASNLPSTAAPVNLPAAKETPPTTGEALEAGGESVRSPERVKADSNWSIHCKVDIVLLNCIKGKKHHHEACVYRFNNNMTDRGFAPFVNLNMVTKEEGFLDPAGKLHLECRVRRCSDLATLSLRNQDTKKMTGK